jgi:hypothetical protein
MENHNPELVPKIHPATREMLPEDPMEMQAFEIPGDPMLMLRLLVEEFARMGTSADEIMRLARDPFYQSFHNLWQLYGEDDLRRRVAETIARCGVTRVRTVQAQPAPENLVQLQTIRPK